MAQISVEIIRLPGSLLRGNLQGIFTSETHSGVARYWLPSRLNDMGTRAITNQRMREHLIQTGRRISGFDSVTAPSITKVVRHNSDFAVAES